MPTKTTYVADADLPIFERAQALAGDNLSATIVQAPRRFVQAHDAGRVDTDLDVDIDLDGGFGTWRSEKRSHGHAKGKVGEIAVQVGDNGTYITRRFSSRLLARRGKHEANAPADADWSAFDWTAYGEANVLRLDVYDTPAARREHIPLELFTAVDEALRGSDAEFLDI